MNLYMNGKAKISYLTGRDELKEALIGFATDGFIYRRCQQCGILVFNTTEQSTTHQTTQNCLFCHLIPFLSYKQYLQFLCKTNSLTFYFDFQHWQGEEGKF